MTPESWPQNLDTLNVSLQMQLGLKSSLTTQMQKKASSWADDGSL